MSQLPKAILLDDTAFRALQAVGLAEEMRQRSILGYGARYLTSGMECFASNDDLRGVNGYPRRNSFSQPVLEGGLLQGLARWPTVHTCFHTSIAHLDSSSEDSVTVHLTQPGGRHRSERERQRGRETAAHACAHAHTHTRTRTHI